VLVLFADEMVEELRRDLESTGVDALGDLDDELADPMEVETVETDALEPGEPVQRLQVELVGEFRAVGGRRRARNTPAMVRNGDAAGTR
jgi:hypothetical protein